MVFDGRVHINEVRDNPWEIRADESDKWVRDILVRSAPSQELTQLSPEAWAEKSKLDVDVKITKMGTDYIVEGGLTGLVQAPCARCAELFQAPRESRFRLFLHRDVHARGEEEGPMEDPDYIVFSSDHIELVELFSEQLIVLEPFAENCQACAEKPRFMGTEDAGQSEAIKASSPFLKLAELKKKL